MWSLPHPWESVSALNIPIIYLGFLLPLGCEGWRKGVSTLLSSPSCLGCTEILPFAAAGEEHPAGGWQDDASLPVLQRVC